jgi:hypothetical protein
MRKWIVLNCSPTDIKQQYFYMEKGRNIHFQNQFSHLIPNGIYEGGCGHNKCHIPDLPLSHEERL